MEFEPQENPEQSALDIRNKRAMDTHRRSIECEEAWSEVASMALRDIYIAENVMSRLPGWARREWHPEVDYSSSWHPSDQFQQVRAKFIRTSEEALGTGPAVILALPFVLPEAAKITGVEVWAGSRLDVLGLGTKLKEHYDRQQSARGAYQDVEEARWYMYGGERLLGKIAALELEDGEELVVSKEQLHEAVMEWANLSDYRRHMEKKQVGELYSRKSRTPLSLETIRLHSISSLLEQLQAGASLHQNQHRRDAWFSSEDGNKLRIKVQDVPAYYRDAYVEYSGSHVAKSLFNKHDDPIEEQKPLRELLG